MSMGIWPFIPQREMIESLEWLTDVIRCKAGEARTSLRLAPRQGYSFTSILSPYEYAVARVFSRGQVGEFELPMWPHLHNTGNLFAGAMAIPGDYDGELYLGPVLVWEHSTKWERQDVVAVDGGLQLSVPLASDYTNALVAPLQVVTLAQAIDFRNTNGDLWLADIRTKAIAARVLELEAAPYQHRGVDVLLDPNITTRSLVEQHSREVEEVDSETGRLTKVPRYTTAETKSTMSWHPIDRAELSTTLRWIHSRRGRRQAFWYLSHNKDLEAQGPLEANGTGTDRLVVKNIPGLSVPFDIAILRSTGARRFYRTQAVEAIGETQQRLILTGNAGSPWPQAEIVEVCFMSGVRFNSDRVEVRHTHGGAATISVPIIEVPGL